MNSNVFRALFADALFQVLDNRAFRVLCVLVALPILATFLIGFREDEVVLLFGTWSYSYDTLFSTFAGGAHVVGDTGQIRQQSIQIVQTVFVEGLAGSVGIFISIAATAFFVPRMAEKGAADTLFSKPVSRMTLYLSRYFAGLLFVALLGTVLVVGMYLGFLVSSHYNDTGLLWGAVTLTYLFALIHCVSMWVGIVTRSSVAAILITIVFFLGNGCVHGGWQLKEFALSQDEGSRAELEDATFLRWVVKTIDVMHYTLPKTSDSDYLTAMLRKSLEEPRLSFRDPLTNLGLEEGLPGYEEQPLTADEVAAMEQKTDHEPGTEVVLFRARKGATRVEIRRRLEAQVEFGSTGGNRRETFDEAIDSMQERLEATSGVLDVRRIPDQEVAGRNAELLAWSASTPAGIRHHEAATYYSFQRQKRGSWFVTIEVETDDQGLDDEGRAKAMLAALQELGFAAGSLAGQEMDPDTWYRSVFGWRSELKYNAFFSIGSSLAFVAVMLLLGWWKLNRIDF